MDDQHARPADSLPMATLVGDKKSPQAWFWFLALIACAAANLWLQYRVLRLSYHLGLTNTGGPADGFFKAVPFAIGWFILTLGQYLLLMILVMRRPGSRMALKLAATAITIVGTFSCVAGHFLSLGGTYDEGFAQWTGTQIDDNAIRSWAASLPAVTTPTAVPRATQPPSIRVHAPAAVEQHPGQGVVLQWGVLASWGTSRKVFIAPDARVTPPADPLHPWTSIRPGLWMAVQITN